MFSAFCVCSMRYCNLSLRMEFTISHAATWFNIVFCFKFGSLRQSILMSALPSVSFISSSTSGMTQTLSVCPWPIPRMRYAPCA